MTARVLIHCDAVHPERTPRACRAFLVTRAATVPVAYEQAEAAGWTQDVGDIDYCPSCSTNLEAVTS